MPKLIDHDLRRQDLAEATWRVILREGVGRASVRAVAAEAGVSTGSLRYAFSTQADLLEFCMRLVVERATVRVRAVAENLPVRERVQAMAQELLPLDATRRAEIEVNLLLVALAASEPRLAAVRDEAHSAIAFGCERMLGLLVADGFARADLAVDVEARRLHAVLDGLAMHLAHRPADSDTGWAVRVLELHLDSLGSVER